MLNMMRYMGPIINWRLNIRWKNPISIKPIETEAIVKLSDILSACGLMNLQHPISEILQPIAFCLFPLRLHPGFGTGKTDEAEKNRWIIHDIRQS